MRISVSPIVAGVAHAQSDPAVRRRVGQREQLGLAAGHLLPGDRLLRLAVRPEGLAFRLAANGLELGPGLCQGLLRFLDLLGQPRGPAGVPVPTCSSIDVS